MKATATTRRWICSRCGARPDAGGLEDLIAEALGADKADLVDADLTLYARQTPTTIGPDGEYFMSPRIDDLECAATTLSAFLEAGQDTDSACRAVWAMLDNEEVGSGNPPGRAEQLFCATRSTASMIRCRTAGRACCARSPIPFCSAPTTPTQPTRTFADKADPANPVRMGGGIVLKVNASQKYTTNALSGALLREICRLAGVPVQLFANRADLPGGSTLGNLQSHTLPIPMADIGLAQLGMHSAVETAATADADAMVKAVARFYTVHLRCLGDGQYTLEALA